jgi:glycosyltransferase involved in cell wall biosynthesis
MERSLGRNIVWLDGKDKNISWPSLNLPVPNVLFCGGYATPAFNSLAKQVWAANGAVVLMSDNNWHGHLRHRFLDRIRQSQMLQTRANGVFVPGASAFSVARAWGYEPKDIETNLYGADPSVFHGGSALASRPKTFLFVGQFIHRKNVLTLTDAFLRFADAFPDWALRLCGHGPLADTIPIHPRIHTHGFVQPAELAVIMRDARCLVLPSREEHWGLVVHEAALSGSALLLSSAVGAAYDLAVPENAILFPPSNTGALVRAMCTLASWTDDRWSLAEEVSKRLASKFGPIPFANSVLSFVRRFSDIA